MRALLSFLCVAASAVAQVQHFSAYLDGAQEVPATASAGHGFGIVSLDGATNVVSLFCYHEGLTSPTVGGHLHLGAAGSNGGVVVGMTNTAPNTWTGSGVLSPAQAALLASSGMYLNIHTTTFPGGEIRGQVVAPRSTRYSGVLTGAQEVPATGSVASGSVFAWLHEPDNRLVYTVQTTGLASVVAAHFHQAAAGANGPVVFGLNGSAQYAGVTPRLTASQMAALAADGFYANVHPSAFPGGEIRGQLLRDRGEHFVTQLAGANEVPPTPSANVGGAQLIVNPNGTVTVSGGYQVFGTATVGAHVHRGAVGVNGPVVFGLSFAGGVLSGSYAPSAADLADLRSGLWYINVHSAAFGGGEIRGQLSAATLPTFYGEGCVSTSGNRPHMGATGLPSMGSSWSMDLYGVPPSTLSLILISDLRLSGAIELPTVGLGAPGCFALIPTIVLQYTAFADARGLATQALPIPVDPFLRNIPLYVQCATLDAGANAANLVTSNAMSFVVQ